MCWKLSAACFVECSLNLNCQYCPHIETSQLIFCANQLTGFYMRVTLATNGLNRIFTRKCKTAFSTTFRTMKMKAGVCSVFLMFVGLRRKKKRNFGNWKRKSMHSVFG